MGDCDSDDDCLPGLRCFQRSGSSSVNSCAAGGVGDVVSFDYCTGLPELISGKDATAEVLLVSVDGGAEQSVEISANCDSLSAAAGAITIAGASVGVSGSVLVITSDTVGAGSSIAVGAGSGSHAKALFGDGVSEAGVDAQMLALAARRRAQVAPKSSFSKSTVSIPSWQALLPKAMQNAVTSSRA